MNRAGQQQIFDEWMAERQGLVFKVVRAYAFSAEDRDDLFQEIATQLWRSIPQFRGDASPNTWIYRIALNCALRWSQQQRKRREGQERHAESEMVLRQSPAQPDPRLEWLYDQIGQMEPVDRSLTLMLLEGFSYREMAELVGISESHVGVKIHRLKEELSRRSEEAALS
jgi:RNA polymerase sigma-70 factor (ECF subfamily)